ncbi:4-alpha-glucanotransferase [bacterium F11]|nr:4-alpha-glucanotransferase [bacterium F11]
MKRGFSTFCRKEKAWLQPYAIYSSLKDYHHGAPWWNWDSSLRNRKGKTYTNLVKKLSHQIDTYQFIQYLFHIQWRDLHQYAKKKRVGLIGDLPIFVAHDSADVWLNRPFFSLENDGRIKFVAGVPPDYFSQDGQLWGTPVYRWENLNKQGYKWWINRLQKSLSLFDVVRLDHFIGFERYWAVPGSAPTAQYGSWKKGPGAHFFQRVLRKIPNAQIIAEDLGSVTAEVTALREQFGFPGMRVLQFAFETHPGAEINRPFNFNPNSVVYTGTHDNDTTVGWFKNLLQNGTREKELVLHYTKSSGQHIHWDLIRLAMMTQANTVIVPIQDILGLGSEARMNKPGSTEGNWEWRLAEKCLTSDIIRILRQLTQTYSRT